MITAIIIDDEAKGRLVLREKLLTYCKNVQVVGEASDGEEAIRLIKFYHPQMIFLDIEMPRMDAFEMLNEIKEKDFHIIFTTAYDQYAIKAIKYAAFDYLLKPIDIEELKTAISKVEINIGSTESNQTKDQVELLQQNMKAAQKKICKLAIPSLDGLLFYDIRDIIHLEANSNYTNIFLKKNKKVVASRTLKEFEELLPEDDFFRCHHSHLINLNYIRRYIKGDGGQIELKDGRIVDVSRSKKDQFLNRINNGLRFL